VKQGRVSKALPDKNSSQEQTKRKELAQMKNIRLTKENHKSRKKRINLEITMASASTMLPFLASTTLYTL
jgi:hypothetical protein